MQSYHLDYISLPQTLEALVEAGYVPREVIEDPKSGIPYSYRALDGTQFEICAEFATDNRNDMDAMNPFGGMGAMSTFGLTDTGPFDMPGDPLPHDAERTCFRDSVGPHLRGSQLELLRKIQSE